jgi:hypothetical protein
MGPQGPQGPAGTSGAVTGYQLVSTGLTTQTLVGGNTTTLLVTCPIGKRVFGGGFDVPTSPAVPVHPVSMFPPTDNTYRVILRLDQDPTTTATIQFRVYAVCGNALN